MNNLFDVIWIEGLKAIRSRIPWFTMLGFLLAPFACAIMMLIYKDPQFARQAGLISAKANLLGGVADWPSYISMLAQAIAIGGLMLFSLVASWVFGREFADGTLKDLLALPTGRSTILLAKYIVTGLWSCGLAIFVACVGIGLGLVIGLAGGSSPVIIHGVSILMVTALLVILVIAPIGFFASFGRGYLLQMSLALLTLVLANLAAITGWGDYFPWAVPALYAKMMTEGGPPLEPFSYWVVLSTCLAGLLGTSAWWRYADHH